MFCISVKAEQSRLAIARKMTVPKISRDDQENIQVTWPHISCNGKNAYFTGYRVLVLRDSRDLKDTQAGTERTFKIQSIDEWHCIAWFMGMLLYLNCFVLCILVFLIIKKLPRCCWCHLQADMQILPYDYCKIVIVVYVVWQLMVAIYLNEEKGALLPWWKKSSYSLLVRLTGWLFGRQEKKVAHPSTTSTCWFPTDKLQWNLEHLIPMMYRTRGMVSMFKSCVPLNATGRIFGLLHW